MSYLYCLRDGLGTRFSFQCTARRGPSVLLWRTCLFPALLSAERIGVSLSVVSNLCSSLCSLKLVSREGRVVLAGAVIGVIAECSVACWVWLFSECSVNNGALKCSHSCGKDLPVWTI